MSANIRQKQILDMLASDGTVSVRALKNKLFVSEATIRRDLTELEKIGALKRTFGGATPVTETNRQVPLFIRESVNAIAKNEICKRAVELVKEGDSIFIDGSSTAQCLIKYLANIQDITVVTYSIKTATLTCEHHIQTYCTGGLLMENSLVCTGQDAIDFSEKVNLDICFMSCKGLNAEGVLTDTSEEETVIRRAFLKRSGKRIFLMTNNKFGNTYFHTVCTAKEIDDIVTDGTLPDNIKTRSSK